jgi:HJR/Mrr/RecB family endonuclease
MIQLSSRNLVKELYSKLTPGEFERFISLLLSEMGFSDVRVTGKVGDRGIDLARASARYF